jgi:Na+-transporting NADH:ubiquinone oxidoreductase subunit C
MNKNLQMFLFIIVLGLFTSGLLIGMDALTRDTIQRNAAVELRSKLLDANKLTYTTQSINDVYEASFEVIEIDGLTFYLNTENDAVSFIFEGNGVWGPITGVLTLDPAFETILGVEILAQEETPGLGGRITEAPYLESFEGILVVPSIMIRKDPAPNQANEVDAITGATATSSRFETLLNEQIEAYRTAWFSEREDEQ